MRLLRLDTAMLFCCAIAATVSCAPAPEPEEALRQWLESAEAAAEDKDRPRLMKMISASYVDARGNDRSGIDRILRLLFLRVSEVALVSKIDELTIAGDSAANVRLTSGLAGRNGGSRFGLSGDVYRFELELEMEGGDWLLIGARWGKLGEDLR
ncbi:MAG: hypothetical protein WD448_10530 [Woeseia sp.]